MSRELPGFQLSLPSGRVLKEEIAYSDGVVALRDTHGDASHTMVTWTAGATSREDFTDGMVIFGKELGGASSPVIEPTNGSDVLSGTMIATDGTNVRMTTMPCASRIVQLMTSNVDATANDALHRSIVASFRCTPSPVDERAISKGVVRYSMTLPGWTAIRKDLDSVMLIADAGSIILVDDRVDTLRAADILASPRSLLSDVKIGVKKGQRETFTATAGVPVEGWIQIIQCAPLTRIFVVAIAPTKQGLDDITQLATSGRCLRANEMPPVWPDAAPAN